MLLTFLSGLGTMAGLIVAVGPQNTFLLRQGLISPKRIVALLVAFCAAADVAFIAVGVAGMGAIIASLPVLMWIIRYAGAAFIAWFGVQAVRRVFRTEALIVADSSDAETEPLRKLLLVAAGFTFLNPGVYIDTLMLVGGIANQHAEPWLWASGAMVASVVWFVAIAFGARALRPLFARPVTWRIFDAIVAVIMLSVATSLVLGA
ncbi:MAG TPA: LysE family transporter [Microbacteriaceae bacterium]|nr:LysE family transporter [Microbacteriaceae bacterium]